MHFLSHINGLWKVRRKVFPNVDACGYVKIFTNNKLETILSEKFLINHRYLSTYGINEFLIKIIKNKIVFFFNTGPNKGKLFQKFELSLFPKTSIFYCCKDIYQTNLFYINKNYFRITHKVRGKKFFFINTHYFKTNNINLFKNFFK